MKEETNETTGTPSDAQMNDMYRNALLDYHADAQQAKQELNRRYAKMVNTFGSYKHMPGGLKEILKQDYAAHEAKWGENGSEMQKRFGVTEPESAVPLTGTTEQTSEGEQAEKRQAFLQRLQQQRQQQSQSAELEC